MKILFTPESLIYTRYTDIPWLEIRNLHTFPMVVERVSLDFISPTEGRLVGSLYSAWKKNESHPQGDSCYLGPSSVSVCT